jgi:hypothetical protein
MEDARFFQQQANRCYQLAWQSFDLPVAHKLNLLGNEHIAKARERRLQETSLARNRGDASEEIGRSQEAPIGSTR